VVTEWTELPLSRAREQARASTQRHELTAALDVLWEGDHEQRVRAISLAEVTVHTELLERALATGDPGLCRQVLTCTALPRLNPELVTATLLRLPYIVRRAAYRHIWTCRARQLADAAVDVVLAHYGENEATWLLPACSESVVEAMLPQLMHAIPVRGEEESEAREIAAYNGDKHVVNLPTKIAHRHPALLLTEAERQLSALPEKWWPQWLGHRLSILLAAARHKPLRLLDLFERFPVSLPFRFFWPKAGLHALIRADAARCVRVATGQVDPGTSNYGLAEAIFREKTVLRTLAKKDPVSLVELARRYPERCRLDWEVLRMVLPILPPEQGLALVRLQPARHRNDVLAELGLIDPELSEHLSRSLATSRKPKVAAPKGTQHDSTGEPWSWAAFRRRFWV
jgi:hypothetical protein